MLRVVCIQVLEFSGEVLLSWKQFEFFIPSSCLRCKSWRRRLCYWLRHWSDNNCGWLPVSDGWWSQIFRYGKKRHRMKVNKHLPRRNMGELIRLAVRSLGCRWRRKPILTSQLFLPPLPAKYQSWNRRSKWHIGSISLKTDENVGISGRMLQELVSGKMRSCVKRERVVIYKPGNIVHMSSHPSVSFLGKGDRNSCCLLKENPTTWNL